MQSCNTPDHSLWKSVWMSCQSYRDPHCPEQCFRLESVRGYVLRYSARLWLNEAMLETCKEVEHH